MTPERLHDLAARTRDRIDYSASRWNDEVGTPWHDADRERLASDLATYDLAVEGLAACRPYPHDLRMQSHVLRYTAVRDLAVVSVERTARLYGVEP